MVIFPAAREIYATERQTMDPHSNTGQPFHCRSHVHRVAPEAIKFGDDQNVAFFHAVEQLRENWSLCCRNAA